MAHDVEQVRTGVARPIGPVGPEWSPEPQIITPVQNVQAWEWANQLTPPALSGTVQEKWVKVAAPIRAVALCVLWITWHWARFGALVVVLGLLTVLIAVR